MTFKSMKPTERYAAVALLLLVALVIVVGFWDTGEPEQKPFEDEILAGGAATRLEESARPASRRMTDNGRAGRQEGATRSVPLSGQSGSAPRVDKVSTRTFSTAGHRVSPDADSDPSGAGAPTVRVEKHPKVAQSPDQLADALRPTKKRGGTGFDLSIDRPEMSGAPSGPFLSRRTPKNERTTGAVEGKERMAAETSVEVAKTRKKEAADLKKAVSDPTLRSYEVKSGDALSRIAKAECGSDRAVAEIARLNGLVDSDIIFPGMILKLPSRASVPSKIASAASSTSGNTAGRRTIRIQSGEVLGHVLEREFGTYRRSIALVRQLNPGLDPNNVQVGQKIMLPARSEVPGAKASAKRVADAPRIAANTAPKSRAGRNSNGQFIVR